MSRQKVISSLTSERLQVETISFVWNGVSGAKVFLRSFYCWRDGMCFLEKVKLAKLCLISDTTHLKWRAYEFVQKCSANPSLIAEYGRKKQVLNTMLCVEGLELVLLGQWFPKSDQCFWQPESERCLFWRLRCSTFIWGLYVRDLWPFLIKVYFD